MCRGHRDPTSVRMTYTQTDPTTTKNIGGGAGTSLLSSLRVRRTVPSGGFRGTIGSVWGTGNSIFGYTTLLEAVIC